MNAPADAVPREPLDEVDEELDSILASMPVEVFDDDEEARLDAEAEADFAAGRFATNDQVREWLKTWGKGPPQPPPMPWLK